MQYLKKNDPPLFWSLSPFKKKFGSDLMYLIHMNSKCVDHFYKFERVVSNVFPTRSTLNQGG